MKARPKDLFKELFSKLGISTLYSQYNFPILRGPGVDSRRYQIFWVAVGLEQGPLSLVSISEELLERKSCGSGLENWD
jgi:hypothetical protein